MTKVAISRRRFLSSATIGGTGLVLSGCNVLDGLDNDSTVRRILASANDLTYRVQRWLAPDGALAEEFSEADIRQPQRPNGTTAPDDESYKALAANNFADWRLEVAGLVEKPLSFSLATLQAMPSQTQITRHDCVEGCRAPRQV